MPLTEEKEEPLTIFEELFLNAVCNNRSFYVYLMSPIITLTKAYSIRLRNTKNVQEDINMSIA